MKRILFISVAFLYSAISFAQSPDDALRYSWYPPSTGTARVQALGGASGAIGGEISTIFSNPANIGFYKTGDLVISGGINANSNTGTYLGDSYKVKNGVTGFLGTSGVVFGKEHYGRSLKSSAFGIAINRTADFNNKIDYDGVNHESSMAHAFIQDRLQYGNYSQFGSDLAYRTYWVDSIGGQLSSPAFALLGSGNAGLRQAQLVKSTGGITEIALAGAANLNDNFYIGASLGLPILRYYSDRVYTESDESQVSNNNFDFAAFHDNLSVEGMGINARIGVVGKPTEAVRLGLAFQSPTFLTMKEYYYSDVTTRLEGYKGTQQELYVASNDAEYNNNGVLESNYSLQTPYKITGSAAFMFGNTADVRSQKGFISADVEYVNYMANQFRYYNDNGFDPDYYKKVNQKIDDSFKGAVNARLGAEMKFNTFMVRLGGAYYGNPYKGVADAKGDITQITGGFGYRNRGFFVDLGYVHTLQTDVNYPYRTESPVPFYGATIKSSSPRVLLTLGFKI